MMRYLVPTLILVLCSSAECGLVTLYSGTGLPANEAWLSYGNDALLSGGSATQNSVAGGVELQTNLAVSAGYSNYLPVFSLKNNAFPALSRTDGFALDFRLQVQSENHTSADRAGFSVILLDQDHLGIELGFWENEIWAQSDNPLFTHAESAAVSTTSAHDYRLEILGSGYTLFQSGTQVLAGSLRNYEAFSGPVDPYELPRFLYLGDNTSSAEASIVLGAVVLTTTLAAVPEPSLLIPLSLLLAGFCVHSRRQQLSGSAS